MFDSDNKENPIVKSILDNLSSVIETLKTEITNIDETYRKKLEEAKKSLNACLEETQKQYDYWAGLSDVNISAAPKKRRSRKSAVEAAAPAADEVVVDAEQSAPDDDALPFDASKEETVVDKEEAPVSLPTLFGKNKKEPATEEPRDLDAEEDADWDEKIESGELKKVEPEKSDDDWGDEEKKDEEDWENDFPEEWK